MIRQYWLLFLLATLSLGSLLNELEENYKSRRSLRKEWRGLGRLQGSNGFRDHVWAGQYMPDKAVRWEPNEMDESPVAAVDLCGHSCKEGVSIFGFAVCQVDWQTGCPDIPAPEGVKPETQLYDLCPKECDDVNPDKKDDGVLHHIKVWTAHDGKEWDQTKIRIELMPQPNPNINKKPRRDHKCVCTAPTCPKPQKKEIKVDPKKLARAKGEKPPPEDTKKDAETKKESLDSSTKDMPELRVGEDFEWVLSGKEEETNSNACPQCCIVAWKSNWNHVIFHQLNEDHQDEPTTEVEVAFPEDSEEH